ncbi:hypothetical protein [Amycolatopsis sp. NPDC052450]|uniref:hypothetical protein n=1 Tax=Amycolatopsis sp. NPDC052450 TaxID=3363937 RepID=UPI0037C84C00
MPEPQVIAWHAVLDLDEYLSTPWVLVGGQMVALWCAEGEVAVFRPTEDADVVLDVWVHRGALKYASRLLSERGFTETKTEDGYGYRYQRGKASVDLMIPDHMERQVKQPATTTGRLGFQAAGGNQALIRAERIPVTVRGRNGHVRRPNLLGALVAKAAAAVADTREPDRHRDDIAVLAKIALNASAHRTMRDSCNPKDRRRLRLALDAMPPTHPAWQRITQAELAREALHRLAHNSGS